LKQLILKLIPYKAKSLPFLLKFYSKFQPINKELLFAFGGRSNYWINMGIDLFETEPLFKESILKSDAIIIELGWSSILQNFKKKCPEDYFESESNVYLLIAALQIAVFDFFEEKNIKPNAIIGLSLGEITGIYAAGAISRLDVFKILKSGKIINTLEDRIYISVLFNLSLENLEKISQKIGNIYPVYEVQHDSCIALINKHHINQIRSELTQIDIFFKTTSNEELYPYHTPILDHHKNQILKCFDEIQFSHFKYDYFSASLGKIIPKGSILDNSFWYNFQRKPVLANRIFDAIKISQKKFDIVQIGNDLFQGKKIQSMLSFVNNFQTNLFSTISRKSSRKSLKKTISFLRKQGYRNNRSLNKNSEFDLFIESFNLHNPYFIENPIPFWTYFKQKGNVHYLPTNQSCLVLGYDEIKNILNNTTCYSSEPFSSFDKYLAGSDPPFHTEMRSLLQPIFSKKALNRIEIFTNVKIKELVNNFPPSNEFNFVDYFSLPLSQTVITHFLGLNDEQSYKKTVAREIV
jgi:hypothetical protein